MGIPDEVIEQTVQYGVLYYVVPEGLTEEEIELVGETGNYGVLDLVGKLALRELDNNSNLFPHFELMACDSEGFGKYGFISEFAIEVVAEVLEINSDDYEKAVLDFLDDDDHHESISINDFVAIVKQIQENE